VDAVIAEQVVDAVLARGPAQLAMARRGADRLAVLAYHDVRDPGRFAAQLDWLGHHTRLVSLEDVIDAVAGHRTLPERAVLITFDDGHRSVLDHALPLLQERGAPAAVYVVAGVIGTDLPLWTDEVRHLWTAGGRVEGVPAADGSDLVRAMKAVGDDARRRALAELQERASSPAPRQRQLEAEDLLRLEAGGVAVGNHSLSHPCLPRCDDATIDHEVTESHRLLTDLLGHPPRSFAYPNGDVDDRVADAVRRAGHPVAFLFDHRLTDLPPADPLRISRLRVNADEGLDRFRAIVSGLHSALHRLRGRS
jgi:peptidoglycan/xylan/chitin deacetylase (PgdA/CDA1 family)